MRRKICIWINWICEWNNYVSYTLVCVHFIVCSIYVCSCSILRHIPVRHFQSVIFQSCKFSYPDIKQAWTESSCDQHGRKSIGNQPSVDKVDRQNNQVNRCVRLNQLPGLLSPITPPTLTRQDKIVLSRRLVRVGGVNKLLQTNKTTTEYM